MCSLELPRRLLEAGVRIDHLQKLLGGDWKSRI